MSKSNDFENKRNYLPDFSDLISHHSFTFREFPVDSNFQIISVTALDSLKNGFDFYLHFKKKENNWQLANVCRLSRAVVADLWMVHFTDQEVDSIINSNDPEKLLYSREQFERIQQLYELTMSLDDSIVSYFKLNLESFNKLSDSYHQFRKENGQKITMNEGTLFSINEDKLIITEIIEAPDELLVFLIRNTYKGSVGYMHCPQENRLPDVLKNGKVIFIREIGDGWYMFKGKGKLH